MQRWRACFTRPAPTPFPAHSRSVANCRRSRQGTGSGGWPMRTDLRKIEGSLGRRAVCLSHALGASLAEFDGSGPNEAGPLYMRAIDRMLKPG
jgi:hypothetical protein